MTILQTGKDKIKQICDTIKEEALVPAKNEAETLITQAQATARKLIDQAKAEASLILKEAKETIERERSVFESSMRQGAQQSLESLRQDIESKLFNKELSSALSSEMEGSHFIGSLLNAMVKAIDEGGMKADLNAVIGKNVNKEEAIAQLGSQMITKLTEDSLSVGTFSGGAQLCVKNRQFTLDMSDEALMEMLAQYLRRDFREWLFKIA